MFRNQQELIAGDLPDCLAMPAPQGCAALMIGDSFGNIDAAQPCLCAAQAEIHVFQIRLEFFVQQPHLLKYSSSKYGGGERR